jgi:hypothetical protein
VNTAEPRTDTAPSRSVVDELHAIARHYDCEAEAAAFLERARPWLTHYAEFVLCERGFEVVTGGCGARAAEAVLELAMAASPRTRRNFAACCARFEGVMVGLKVGFGLRAAPTLYVRAKCPLEAGLEFVSRDFGEHVAAQLRTALRGNHTLYGLGFSDDDDGPVLKTYTLRAGREPGFVSWRVRGGQLQHEYKTYEADLPLWSSSADGETWRQHLEFATRELGWQVANNVGRVTGGTRATKFYVERVGAIPTDSSAV